MLLIIVQDGIDLELDARRRLLLVEVLEGDHWGDEVQDIVILGYLRVWRGLNSQHLLVHHLHELVLRRLAPLWLFNELLLVKFYFVFITAYKVFELILLKEGPVL